MKERKNALSIIRLGVMLAMCFMLLSVNNIRQDADRKSRNDSEETASPQDVFGSEDDYEL